MNKEELLTLYDKLKGFARRAIETRDYKFSLDYIRSFSYIAYTFGFRYTDDEAEDMLNQISQQIKKKEPLRDAAGTHRCVMIDSLSEYHGGLTVQYLRAIKAAGWDILYLSDTDLSQRHRSDLRKELASNPKLKAVSVPRYKRGLKRCQFMYDTIMDYNPENVFIHIAPHAAYPATVCYALPPQMKKYLINYTDHSFLLGTGCVNKSFEFTNYGASYSWRFRHIDESDMFKLPYYSFADDVAFQGLPDIAKGKVVIFSGGNYWKIIDEADTFFKLVKAILDRCPNAVVLYAGTGNDIPVKAAIEKYKIGDRFVLLGWRNDISELFNHCDIYLSTYPSPGGLMSQFAARAGKPILAYEPSGRKITEIFVCQVRKIDITIDTIEKFVEEVQRLLEDPTYRGIRGEEMRSCVLSVNEFNEKFKMAVEQNKPTGIPFNINRIIGPKAESYIDNNIKVHANGNVVENSMVFFMGYKALKVLSFADVWRYKKKQVKQYRNLVINRLKQIFLCVS